MNKKSPEHLRLDSLEEDDISTWRKWGPYVSERAWGTVREDYSADGDAWNFLSHDMARSKAYRWGEDGLAGISDYYQTMVFSIALWNGKDHILKERLFGLTPYEGNHGEDVKECYYYLDATPTHSYLRYLYKYPIDGYPYSELVEKNKVRGPHDREFEIYDTAVFDHGRYFDVYVEYAKQDVQDICIKIEVFNRSSQAATIDLIPQIWYRNQWSWKEHLGVVPEISIDSDKGGITCLLADSSQLPQPAAIVSGYSVPTMYLYGAKPSEVLFTDNETNNQKLYGKDVKSKSDYTKDAFHRYIVNAEHATNPEKKGTKACFYYKNILIEAHSSKVFYFRLTDGKVQSPLESVESVIRLRQRESDIFYEAIQSKNIPEQDKKIQRSALAGMIWSKQFYYYNVKKWLSGDNPNFPPPQGRGNIRNGKWKHIYALDVFSMPDKWEYPWFAAWDLAFHAITFSLVDTSFAKNQIRILLTHMYQHSNGQIPAYEWGFSDLNPPVQALALYRIYLHEMEETGEGDRYFLHWGFLKVIRNFDWWLNRVDRMGNNLFEGGFLGLDNISFIDRSEKLSDGGIIVQSDATGWMGLYAIALMRMALELAKDMPVYEGLATVFFEQFVYISNTMHDKNKMWDHEDGFFYDIILYPDGRIERLKIRSFVGIIPFYSLFSLDESEISRFEKFYKRIKDFEKHNSEIVSRCLTRVSLHGTTKFLFSMMSLEQINRVFAKVFDPDEFLSDYGLRSVSKYHDKHPLSFQGRSLQYEPGESLEKIKGGNSNWRGPIWLPTNFLFIDSLVKLSKCLGEDYTVTMADGSCKTLSELKKMLRERLVSIFRSNSNGKRPVHGDVDIYSENKDWQDLILFYEHYHGETGRGLGASHQTGWSGLVANMIYLLYPHD